MGDEPLTRADFNAALTALKVQIAALAIQLNNNANNNNIDVINILSIGSYAPEIDAVSLSIETLDEKEPSLLEKLNDSADHSKPKEVEVVAEQDTLFEDDKSKDEKKEIEKQDDSEKDDVDEGGDEIEKKQNESFVKLPTESHKKSYTLSLSEKKLDGIVKETINAKFEATWQKKKADADKLRRYKYIVAISNSMNISNSFDVPDSHEYQAFNQDENSGSGSFEIEEKVKTSKAGASTRLSDSSTQTFVFDPGIHVITTELEVEFFIRRGV
ncbi:hypothetical protein QL285_034852 [Trifolium repens]|nr:hypothetical protein QL285_034852 [Trifolium repens]